MVSAAFRLGEEHAFCLGGCVSLGVDETPAAEAKHESRGTLYHRKHTSLLKNQMPCSPCLPGVNWTPSTPGLRLAAARRLSQRRRRTPTTLSKCRCVPCQRGPRTRYPSVRHFQSHPAAAMPTLCAPFYAASTGRQRRARAAAKKGADIEHGLVRRQRSAARIADHLEPVFNSNQVRPARCLGTACASCCERQVVCWTRGCHASPLPCHSS